MNDTAKVGLAIFLVGGIVAALNPAIGAPVVIVGAAAGLIGLISCIGKSGK